MKWLERRAQARQVQFGQDPAPAAPVEPAVDPVVNAILNQNGYDGAAYGGVAALEIAAGVWARAFLSAAVSPSNYATDTLTPAVLARADPQPTRRQGALKILDAFSRLKGGMVVANTNRDEGTSFGVANDPPTTERVEPRPQPEVTELRKAVFHSVAIQLDARRCIRHYKRNGRAISVAEVEELARRHAKDPT